MGLSIDEQKAVDRFRQTVVEPSMTKLVVVDFWAEWCGPCKALTPVLEKVCAEYADKGVVLAKINVDEEGFIASQFQVRSIPTVYAMFQGQPVADLTPARTESQLKGALDQILSQVPVQPGAEGAPDDAEIDIAQLLAMAEDVLARGEAERAASMFMQIGQMAPDSAEAASGVVRALIVAGQMADAQTAYDTLPIEVQARPEMAQAKLALELAANQVDDGELQALRASAAERPADMEAQMAFAEAAFAVGERDEAADTLLRAIGTDPAWNDGAAKAKLLQMFEAVGLEDPWVATTRRRLSLLLFG
ncbi:tetratricopeptide repeat protein [Altererythrobacter sp. KTW20L]|uniref:tetratricopeptide repeat protein n=1 Tax=Altererythrobacter sp. KTW20L TaxID=2942210 RepID=UPI0020BE0B80|nr:tetratricopeptide repeat protein [Altererythrobacter sp. KTW20L]MCL6250102.1 tetratricopeptide repeat protein [Altererythrobacter sp. KTW20L]